MSLAYRSTGTHGPAQGVSRRQPLRLAVALPAVTALLSFAIGLAAYQLGLAAAGARPETLGWLPRAPLSSWGWLAAMTGFGALIGLMIALAFTRQLRSLARRTEFLARRNFSFPVELETDGEVAPVVSAINELLQSVREYARRSLSDGVISFSRDGRILAINPRAAVALGVDAETVIGRSYKELVSGAPANGEIFNALQRAFERSEPFDLRGVTWVNTRGQSLDVDLHGTVLAGDESLISLLIVFEPGVDLEEAQRQVSRAHRLLVIGGFAAELAHEIRNPLASISGLVDVLRDSVPADDAAHRHLDVLSRAADRIDRLVRQLVDLVPTQIEDLEQRDLNRLVKEALELVIAADDRGDRVHVHQSYHPGGLYRLVDPDRLSRAIENLLHNARAHTPDGDEITVSTSLRAEGDIELVVENTGSYVPPEERERIFMPFVSGRVGGTGLGLAIAQQIVFAHGGTLRVESEPDAVTRFVIRLPASGAPAGAATLIRPAASPVSGAA